MAKKPAPPKKPARKPAAKRTTPRKRAPRPGEGRPPKYERDSHPQRAFKLCLLGLKDEELCTAFGITASTFYAWQKAHPEFSEAITSGREPADAEVAQGLYKRSIGYTRKKVVTTTQKGANGEMVTYTQVTEEEVPPDPSAAKHWLGNRQRGKGRWRDNELTLNADEGLLDLLAKVDGATRVLGDGGEGEG